MTDQNEPVNGDAPDAPDTPDTPEASVPDQLEPSNINTNSGGDRLVVVQVTIGSVVMEGGRHTSGSKFVTSLKRAMALGSSVSIVNDPAPGGLGLHAIVPSVKRAKHILRRL